MPDEAAKVKVDGKVDASKTPPPDRAAIDVLGPVTPLVTGLAKASATVHVMRPAATFAPVCVKLLESVFTVVPEIVS